VWPGLVFQRYFEHCEITDRPRALHGTWFLWNFIELFAFILVEFTLSYFIWLDFYIRYLTSWFHSYVLANSIKAPWLWQYFQSVQFIKCRLKIYFIELFWYLRDELSRFCHSLSMCIVVFYVSRFVYFKVHVKIVVSMPRLRFYRRPELNFVYCTTVWRKLLLFDHRRSWHGLTSPFFSNFLFTNLFAIKFLYFFIISSLFPYFNMFVSIFIQSHVNNNLHVSALYRY